MHRELGRDHHCRTGDNDIEHRPGDDVVDSDHHDIVDHINFDDDAASGAGRSGI
jgi:hypothetical protein